MTDRKSAQRRQRLDDLLFARALEGLDPGEHAEMQTLLEEFPEADRGGYEEAAAAVLLAAMPAPEPMPAGLRQRIIDHGMED